MVTKSAIIYYSFEHNTLVSASFLNSFTWVATFLFWLFKTINLAYSRIEPRDEEFVMGFFGYSP